MNRGLPLFFAILALATSAGAVTSAETFTRVFTRMLREKNPALTITETGDLQLQISDAEKHEQTIFLTNAYDAYRQEPKDGRAVLERYVNSVLVSLDMESKPIQRDRIVPIIKDRAWLQETRAALEARGTDASKMHQVWEDYNEDLVVLYGEDTPENIRYFGRDDLAKIAVKPEELRGLAVKNLIALIPKIELHGTPTLYMMTAGGNYEASLLLDQKIWASGQVAVKGDIVVAIPSRDMLLITGSNDTEGLAKLKKLADETAQQAPYRLTPKLFVFRGGKFVRFTQ